MTPDTPERIPPHLYEGTAGDTPWRLHFDIGGALVGPSSLPPPRAVFPGSFNPLHRGHRGLAAAAAARLGAAVHFELSVENPDKPALGRAEAARRVAQFAGVAPVWLTRGAATYARKAGLFPGAAFVLGWDTAVRVIDPRYYGGEAGRDAALGALRDRGCRLVVGGRLSGGEFRVWETPPAVAAFADLFVPLTEADFRADVSSTELRGQTASPG